MQNPVKRAYTVLQVMITIAMITTIVALTNIAISTLKSQFYLTDVKTLNSIFELAIDTYTAHHNDSVEYTIEYLKLNLNDIDYGGNRGVNTVDLSISNINTIDENKAINIVYNSNTFLQNYSTLVKPYTTILYMDTNNRTLYFLYSEKSGKFSIYNMVKI